MLTTQIFVALAGIYGCFAATPVPGGLTGQAITTSYQDCCKPSCGYSDKAPFASQLQTVTVSGTIADPSAQSGCISTDASAAFADPAQQPRAIDSQNAIGYVASGNINGRSERETCCACFELTFLNGPVQGKKMVVQNINTGTDLNQNHFDILIPGGGAGIFTQGCPSQFGNGYKWGAQQGGLSGRDQCSQLPASIQAGCFWRFDWFMAADNPNVSFVQVNCPAELTNVSKCIRADAAPPTTPGTTPGATPTAKATVRPTTKPVTTPCKNRPPGAQCAGKHYKGPTCCPPGTVCRYKEPYYSGCHTTPPVTSQCSPKYGQCGGKIWTGPKCCQTGSKCMFNSEYYSQCL